MSDVTQKRMYISDLACSLSKQNKRMSFLELGKHLNSNGITSNKNKPFSEKKCTRNWTFNKHNILLF